MSTSIQDLDNTIDEMVSRGADLDELRGPVQVRTRLEQRRRERVRTHTGCKLTVILPNGNAATFTQKGKTQPLHPDMKYGQVNCHGKLLSGWAKFAPATCTWRFLPNKASKHAHLAELPGTDKWCGCRFRVLLPNGKRLMFYQVGIVNAARCKQGRVTVPVGRTQKVVSGMAVLRGGVWHFEPAVDGKNAKFAME